MKQLLVLLFLLSIASLIKSEVNICALGGYSIISGSGNVLFDASKSSDIPDGQLNSQVNGSISSVGSIWICTNF